MRARIALFMTSMAASMAAGGPALAQTPGSTVGLPANPFASNYPSEPPPRVRPERIDGGGAARRRRPAAPPSSGRLRPPAGIPGEGTAR